MHAWPDDFADKIEPRRLQEALLTPILALFLTRIKMAIYLRNLLILKPVNAIVLSRIIGFVWQNSMFCQPPLPV